MPVFLILPVFRDPKLIIPLEFHRIIYGRKLECRLRLLVLYSVNYLILHLAF